MDAQTVTLIFTIVTGVGVLLQAFVLLGMFFALKQTQKKVHALSESIEDHVLPLVASSRGLIDDLSPKLKIITANLVDASATLRSQSEQVKSVVDDISSRTRQQTARVDGMVTSALNSINQATAAVERTIAVPLRQVNSVLNGLRAGIEALKGKDPQPAVRTAPRTPPPAPPPVRPVATAPAPASSGITPEEASAAAARFVRDRAAASSGDLR